MHVASRPIAAPVALIEQKYTIDGEPAVRRILVFREGTVPKHLLCALSVLLKHL